MLPTFVIGLREGLEAALIVGIIAAFLRKQGRPELMRQMALGVAAAIAICVAVGVGLKIFSQNLPQQQQEGLETVIGILAVGMVTYMVLWMKEHSRGLKGQLESMTAQALDGNRGQMAMVAMAFLAVLREGFETAVFLLAAFNESSSGMSALVGALLGIGVAVALGYGIYRGGVRINLSKFFRATGVVLVLVAGGLVVSAIHTAHEAGWLNAGQHQLLDLSWLVQPGTVISSLLTGMLGIQPYPVMAEVLGWLLYVVPLIAFVAWPPGRPTPVAALRVALGSVGVVGIGAAVLIALATPSVRIPAPPTGAGAISAALLSKGGHIAVRTADQQPLTHRVGATTDIVLEHGSATNTSGIDSLSYRVALPAAPAHPATLSADTVARLNGGRLPLGVRPDKGRVSATITEPRTLSLTIEPHTRRVLAMTWTQTEQAQLSSSFGQQTPLARPLDSAITGLTAADTSAALAAARHDRSTLETRSAQLSLAWLSGLIGAAGLLGLGLSLVRRPASAGVTRTTSTLAHT